MSVSLSYPYPLLHVCTCMCMYTTVSACIPCVPQSPYAYVYTHVCLYTSMSVSLVWPNLTVHVGKCGYVPCWKTLPRGLFHEKPTKVKLPILLNWNNSCITWDSPTPLCICAQVCVCYLVRCSPFVHLCKGIMYMYASVYLCSDVTRSLCLCLHVYQSVCVSYYPQYPCASVDIHLYTEGSVSVSKISLNALVHVCTERVTNPLRMCETAL